MTVSVAIKRLTSSVLSSFMSVLLYKTEPVPPHLHRVSTSHTMSLTPRSPPQLALNSSDKLGK